MIAYTPVFHLITTKHVEMIQNFTESRKQTEKECKNKKKIFFSASTHGQASILHLLIELTSYKKWTEITLLSTNCTNFKLPGRSTVYL